MTRPRESIVADERVRTDSAGDVAALFLLGLAAMPVQYLLQAVAIFTASGCWPIAWRWNLPYRRATRSWPLVHDPACSHAAGWSIFDSPPWHPLFAVLLAAVVFYAIRPLRTRMRRWIAEAAARGASGEQDE